MTGVFATILVRRDASAFSTRLQRRIERARRRHGVVQIPGLARRRSGHHGDRHGTGRLLKACTALDPEADIARHGALRCSKCYVLAWTSGFSHKQFALNWAADA